MHLFTNVATQQQGNGEHHDGKHSLNHHQHMAPTLTNTTTERATNDINRLIATEYRGGHKTCQRTYHSDDEHKTDDCNDASILQQIHRTGGHLDSLILQGKGYQISHTKSDGSKEDALANQLQEYLQTRQT